MSILEQARIRSIGPDLEFSNIARATEFAYWSNGPYPCVFDDYRDLIDHPKKNDQYREKATAGSILVPTLAVWASINGDEETLGLLANFRIRAVQTFNLAALVSGFRHRRASLSRQHKSWSRCHRYQDLSIVRKICSLRLDPNARNLRRLSHYHRSHTVSGRCSFSHPGITASPVPPHLWPLTTHTNNPE